MGPTGAKDYNQFTNVNKIAMHILVLKAMILWCDIIM